MFVCVCFVFVFIYFNFILSKSVLPKRMLVGIGRSLPSVPESHKPLGPVLAKLTLNEVFAHMHAYMPYTVAIMYPCVHLLSISVLAFCK